MREPTLILFDVDGTLVDTAGAGRRAVERAFVEIWGIDGVPQRHPGVHFAGMTDEAIFRELADAAGIGRATYDRRREELWAAYLRSLRSIMARTDERRRVLPGVRTLLEQLAGLADASMALLTGNLEDGARIKLEPFGLNPHFRTGGFGSDHSDRSEVARLAWERSNSRFERVFERRHTYVVGDTENDVECARANGFVSVAVAAGFASRESLERSRPDVLLDDLGDLRSTLSAFGLGQAELDC